jgi:orotate phosphoribosyltransferase-like protein
MKMSTFRAKRRGELVKKAVRLYRQGWTTREVGKEVGKSHGWVAYVVKKALSPVS